MLGSHTKQVVSYGKRNQRIVAADRDHFQKKEFASVLADIPPTTWAPVVSKMKKRENAVLEKSFLPSPKIIRMRKKRQSPVFSPLRTRVAQIIESDVRKREEFIMDAKRKPVKSKLCRDTIHASPTRTPLGAQTPNLPRSPAVSRRARKTARVPSAKGTSLKLIQPVSPFVDMDIIILDDDGRKVSQERRVSRTRTAAETSPLQSGAHERINAPPAPRNAKLSAIDYDTDSDEDFVPQPKRPTRLRKAMPTAVYSDESDSSDHSDVEPVVPIIPRAPKSKLAAKLPISPPSVVEDFTLETDPSPQHSLVINEPEPNRRPSQSPLPRNNQLQPLPPPIRYHFPSPVARTRQLTPIRGARNRLFEPPSPPSPTTPTDYDVSLDLSELSLGILDSNGQIAGQPEPDIPDHLRPLLRECHQETCGLHEFSAFIQTFPYESIVRNGNYDHFEFRKIGEASYSEVFGIGDVVLKVIPLRDESVGDNSGRLKMTVRYNDAGEEVDGPAPSDAKDVLKEIIVTQAMGAVCEGFVKLLKTYVVRGTYPQVFLELWDRYLEEKGSENVRPDTFSVSQAYAIIVLPNRGSDLEAYTFKGSSKTGWRQACSIFWQVAKALAHAEQLVSFEHRDLHWGQVLIQEVPVPVVSPLKSRNLNQASRVKPPRLYMDDLALGVRATLIDLGLARMDAGDGAGGEMVHWTPFDDEIFMGEGDYQFDIYRIMRAHNGGRWENFDPLTNVMWLHYLLVKLLRFKALKPPSSRKAQVAVNSPGFSERDCYDCLVDLEKWLGERVTGIAIPKGKARKRTKKTPVTNANAGPTCAGEVVGYGTKKDWIQSLS